MAIPQYLAMTAAEMARTAPLPQHPAWMACHFSPYSTGLTNLPAALPPESLLILNDRTPIHGHDPERVCRQLGELLGRFACRGLLVDFQNPPCPESLALAGFLAGHLEFPMGISPEYQIEAPAVFLPPVPTDVKLEDYLSKWGSREIWLEAALEGQDITLTSQGTVSSPNRRRDFDHVHAEKTLHCHYSIQDSPEGMVFHTWRTPEDLAALIKEAEALGVTQTVGLYQEIGDYSPSSFSAPERIQSR